MFVQYSMGKLASASVEHVNLPWHNSLRLLSRVDEVTLSEHPEARNVRVQSNLRLGKVEKALLSSRQLNTHILSKLGWSRFVGTG